MLAIMIVLGALFVLRAKDGASGQARLPSLDPLPEPAASCPEDAQHALHAANAALHAAHARLQRYAFAPRDGRHALARLSEAAECARLAGDAALLAGASTQRAELREQIERDIRDHYQRYELLRQHDRVREAGHDIGYLIALGWPERGPLADQLRLDRDLLESDARKAER